MKPMIMPLPEPDTQKVTANIRHHAKTDNIFSRQLEIDKEDMINYGIV